MSMVLCHLCEAFVDGKEFPDGFYVRGYEDKYICDSCREEKGLTTEFEDNES